MSKALLVLRVMAIHLRIRKYMRLVFVMALALLLVPAVLLGSYTAKINSGLSEKLVRLHVVANSDSEEDQKLKRDIRDKIISFMKTELEGVGDISSSKEIIKKDLEAITTIAHQEIIKHGRDYEVTASLGRYPFPTKAYGDIALPAGSYEALRVVIGKGEGANWWCVLFPPLCFVDVTHGTIPDDVKADLKKVLTKNEYSIIASADSDDEIPIKIKFKIVEFFEDSKIKFTGLISSIFGKQMSKQ